MKTEYETVVVYDTETTGLPDFKKRNRDPAQPSLVQIAAALYRTEKGQENWRREAVLYFLCDRDGKTIHPKALEAHGITEEYSDKFGLQTEDVLFLLVQMFAQADVHVAHNNAFDMKLIKCNLHRHNLADVIDIDDVFPTEKQYCTMKKATSIVKAPKKKGSGYKWPSLEECMQFFFDESIEGAHDALVDVDACANVYFELRRRGV